MSWRIFKEFLCRRFKKHLVLDSDQRQKKLPQGRQLTNDQLAILDAACFDGAKGKLHMSKDRIEFAESAVEGFKDKWMAMLAAFDGKIESQKFNSSEVCFRFGLPFRMAEVLKCLSIGSPYGRADKLKCLLGKGEPYAGLPIGLFCSQF